MMLMINGSVFMRGSALHGNQEGNYRQGNTHAIFICGHVLDDEFLLVGVLLLFTKGVKSICVDLVYKMGNIYYYFYYCMYSRRYLISGQHIFRGVLSVGIWKG